MPASGALCRALDREAIATRSPWHPWKRYSCSGTTWMTC